jgi:hypothetical protein
MAGVSDTAWSLWEIVVTIAGPGGFAAGIAALYRVGKKNGEHDENAKRVKSDLELYRRETKEALAESDRRTERQFATVDAKIGVVQSNMATKRDLHDLGEVIMNSFRASISALGINLRHNAE